MKIRIESLGEILLEADAVDEPKQGDRIIINNIKYDVAFVHSEFAAHEDIPSLSKVAVVARVTKVKVKV